jgi:hypothetical protein
MDNDDIKKRCPNGTRRNKKTKNCEPINKKYTRNDVVIEEKPQQTKRCPNGTRRNKQTGLCEPKEKEKSIQQKNTSAKINTSKNQTNLDTYYPKTQVSVKYTRKQKSPPKIQKKMTEYLNKFTQYFKRGKKEDKETKEKPKTSSSFARKKEEFKKKVAAKKIAQFMANPEVQEKRRTEFLKSICSDSNVCIAFGTEDKKIQGFFNGFTDFQYIVSPIKRIGEVSANGFLFSFFIFFLSSFKILGEFI